MLSYDQEIELTLNELVLAETYLLETLSFWFIYGLFYI